MGFRLTVDGDSKIEFKEDALTQVQFLSNTPNGGKPQGRGRDGLSLGYDADIRPGSGNARATDVGLGVKIWGRINFSLGAEIEDATVTMANWALQASDQAAAYRKAVIQVVASGQVVREYTIPNAFIVEYSEDLDDAEGVGHFYLHLRQKKDLNPKVELKGGFEVG